MTDTSCNNCRHRYVPMFMSQLPPVLWTGPLCMSPQRTETPHSSKPVAISCSTARADGDDCGPDAYGFEPKLRVRLVAFLQSILGGRHAS